MNISIDIAAHVISLSSLQLLVSFQFKNLQTIENLLLFILIMNRNTASIRWKTTYCLKTVRTEIESSVYLRYS